MKHYLFKISLIAVIIGATQAAYGARVNTSLSQVTMKQYSEKLDVTLSAKTLKPEINFTSAQHSGGPSKSDSDRDATVELTCHFEGETFPTFLIYNEEMFKETDFSQWMEEDSWDTYHFHLTPGIYDIASSFFFFEGPGVPGFGFIVYEDVEVKENLQLDFSLDQITDHTFVTAMLKNGERAKVPVGYDIEGQEEPELDYTDSNTLCINYDFILFKDGCESIGLGSSINGFYYEGGTSDLRIYTNGLSEKYNLVTNTIVQIDEENYEISTTAIKGLNTTTHPTYNIDFKEYRTPEFAKTPLYLSEGVKTYKLGVGCSYWINDVNVATSGIYTSAENPNIQVTSQPVADFDLKTVMNMISVQMEKDIEYEYDDGEGGTITSVETVEAEMYALPAWYTGEEWVYINQNHSQCNNSAYQIPAEGSLVCYPGLSQYDFSATSLSQPLGNSAPILVLMTRVREMNDNKMVSLLPQAYIGRYGEVRNCDAVNSEMTVKGENGEILFTNSDGGWIGDWAYDYFAESHVKQTLNYEVRNENVLIDETISGFNLTTSMIDENADDLYPPTPQMLLFKNSEGVIFDRFDVAQDGVVEFSAGDFTWNTTNTGRGYYTVEEADVKVEYAPYGEDAWQPIEVEQVPEYFYMPGFGYFYRGSLDCVDMPSSNGWYDLRMTLTDKAGNRTVEHISPAFKVGAGSGVDGVTIDGLKVWASDGTIRTNATDVSSIVAYALDGSLLASGSTSALYVGGYTGALLVRLTTPAGTTTHKLLLH